MQKRCANQSEKVQRTAVSERNDKPGMRLQVAAAWAAKGADTNLVDHVMLAMKSPPSPESENTLALIAEAKAQMATGAANAPEVRAPSPLKRVAAHTHPCMRRTFLLGSLGLGVRYSARCESFPAGCRYRLTVSNVVLLRFKSHHEGPPRRCICQGRGIPVDDFTGSMDCVVVLLNACN